VHVHNRRGRKHAWVKHLLFGIRQRKARHCDGYQGRRRAGRQGAGRVLLLLLLLLWLLLLPPAAAAAAELEIRAVEVGHGCVCRRESLSMASYKVCNNMLQFWEYGSAVLASLTSSPLW
jgi:hypothetical protein